MPLILKGSDFHCTSIYDYPLIASIQYSNQKILLCIDAQRLSKDVLDTAIDKNKEYKFFPTMGIVTYDGWKNYLMNPRITNNPLGLQLLEYNPILADDSRIIGFEGEVTGICEEKEIFLPNIGLTGEGVVMIQPGFRPGDQFIQKEIGEFIRCYVINILGIDIPIPSIGLDIPIPHKYNIINGEKYTFDCLFGEQSWMDYMYPEKPTGKYQKAFFLSGLIIDAEFDPKSE